MAWSVPSTQVTGYVISASDWNVLVNDLNVINAIGAYTTYAPAFQFGGLTTNIGATTGRYWRTGRAIIGWAGAAISGAPAAGGMSFGLPITAQSANDGFPLGQLYINHGGSVYMGTVLQNAGSTQGIAYSSASPAAQVTNAVPVALGAADFLHIIFEYETAADAP